MTAPDPFDISAEDLNREVAAYREARVRRLTSEKGWLTLVGKVWLSPGTHRIGSAPGCEIALPPEVSPSVLGSVTLEVGDGGQAGQRGQGGQGGQGGIVRFGVGPSAEVFARGERVTTLTLRSDADENPDEVISGSLMLQLIRRENDFAIRVRDSRSPRRLLFRGIPAYPVAPSWRIVARLELFADEKQVTTEDSDGRPQVYQCPGAAVFQKDGIACRIDLVLESNRKMLIVLFTDATNHDTTYEGGRYLYVPLPLPGDGRVLLDFNKCFNPPCAFTPHAACPVPPRQNRIALRVEAGEKRPFDSPG